MGISTKWLISGYLSTKNRPCAALPMALQFLSTCFLFTLISV